MSDFTTLLDHVANGRSLNDDQTTKAFAAIASGEVSDIQVAGFLCALRVKEPTVTELAAAVREMRRRMIAVTAPADAMDILGTGGDGKATYNISTAAAFVLASAGVPVAKQGNRAFSSKCGSADVLAAAGVVISLTPAQLEQCLSQLGICFLFAPDHHPALRSVHQVRQRLGVRTVFNLMGPLMNAANVTRHLVGSYDRRWIRPMAETLGALGSQRAVVVASASGMDEVALDGPTYVAELDQGRVTEWTIDPREVGLAPKGDDQLRGSDSARNAESLRATLGGAPGAFREATAINAGVALYVANRASSVCEGTTLALRLLDSGAPLQLLEEYAELTRTLEKGGHGMTILEKIRNYKVDEVAHASRQTPESELRARLPHSGAVRSVEASLRTAMESGIGVIAEIKRSSPTKGELRQGLDPARCAQDYARGGAAALSVLTDHPSFGGSLEDLAAAHAACQLPVVRKDFIVDPYQLLEARAWSADAVLLIMAILEPRQAADLYTAAVELGLEVIVETHTHDHVEAALSFSARMIGINNRDLHTFHADLATTIRLASDGPADTLVISESGISGPEDVAMLAQHGIRACLVGEALMKQPDLAEAVRTLATAASQKENR